VQHQLAALLVDVDDFKAVNDSHGHAVGDEVLQRVALTLASGIRAGDLVARLGGDEFVALLDGLDADAAYRRAADLLERLATEPWGSVAPGLDLAVSIGVSAGEPGDDPEQLVRRADAALYVAKARGGGRVEAEQPGVDGGQAPSSRVRRTERPQP
jgi:diguanylate cyclase (GGDEF)-like protein